MYHESCITYTPYVELATSYNEKAAVFIACSPSNSVPLITRRKAYIHRGNVVISGLDGKLARTLYNNAEGGIRALQVRLFPVATCM